MRAIDPLSDILSLMRPEAYGFRGLDVGGEWSLHLPPDEVIRCYTLRSGTCGLWLKGEVAPLRMAAGDLVLLPHGQGLVMGSRPDAPPIDLQSFFATADGETSVLEGGGCCGMGGYFELANPCATALLTALPPVVRLETRTAGGALRWLVERLMGELREPRPGNRLIAEHLSQTLLIEALRLHLSSSDALQGSWLAVLADPQLAPVLGAIHADPGARWTLASLAKVAGLCRSAFAQRFALACGEPAIEYLTGWRMLLASDYLMQGVPIATVARELGYRSESAFGVASKRRTGSSPARYKTLGHQTASKQRGAVSLDEQRPAIRLGASPRGPIRGVSL